MGIVVADSPIAAVVAWTQAGAGRGLTVGLTVQDGTFEERC